MTTLFTSLLSVCPQDGDPSNPHEAESKPPQMTFKKLGAEHTAGASTARLSGPRAAQLCLRGTAPTLECPYSQHHCFAPGSPSQAQQC